ncbi:MAG TPA: 50S ribosomal protein L22 [Armatimonadota bacterium]|nr:50S ribosomal protein L22 [Armatimonadota bacterium]
MEIKATLKYLRSTARKTRLVVDMVRGKKVEDAINILNFSPRKAALPVAKLIHSAVANAEEIGEVDVDTLYVKRIFVDEGPTMKRFMPRAMGRATRINKRTSHITVVLDEM